MKGQFSTARDVVIKLVIPILFVTIIAAYLIGYNYSDWLGYQVDISGGETTPDLPYMEYDYDFFKWYDYTPFLYEDNPDYYFDTSHTLEDYLGESFSARDDPELYELYSGSGIDSNICAMIYNCILKMYYFEDDRCDVFVEAVKYEMYIEELSNIIHECDFDIILEGEAGISEHVCYFDGSKTELTRIGNSDNSRYRNSFTICDQEEEPKDDGYNLFYSESKDYGNDGYLKLTINNPIYDENCRFNFDLCYQDSFAYTEYDSSIQLLDFFRNFNPENLRIEEVDHLYDLDVKKDISGWDVLKEKCNKWKRIGADLWDLTKAGGCRAWASICCRAGGELPGCSKGDGEGGWNSKATCWVWNKITKAGRDNCKDCIKHQKSECRDSVGVKGVDWGDLWNDLTESKIADVVYSQHKGDTIIYNFVEFDLDREYTEDEINSIIERGFEDWIFNTFEYWSKNSDYEWVKAEERICEDKPCSEYRDVAEIENAGCAEVCCVDHKEGTHCRDENKDELTESMETYLSENAKYFNFMKYSTIGEGPDKINRFFLEDGEDYSISYDTGCWSNYLTYEMDTIPENEYWNSKGDSGKYVNHIRVLGNCPGGVCSGKLRVGIGFRMDMMQEIVKTVRQKINPKKTAESIKNVAELSEDDEGYLNGKITTWKELYPTITFCSGTSDNIDMSDMDVETGLKVYDFWIDGEEDFLSNSDVFFDSGSIAAKIYSDGTFTGEVPVQLVFTIPEADVKNCKDCYECKPYDESYSEIKIENDLNGDGVIDEDEISTIETDNDMSKRYICSWCEKCGDKEASGGWKYSSCILEGDDVDSYCTLKSSGDQTVGSDGTGHGDEYEIIYDLGNEYYECTEATRCTKLYNSEMNAEFSGTCPDEYDSPDDCSDEVAEVIWKDATITNEGEYGIGIYINKDGTFWESDYENNIFSGTYNNPIPLITGSGKFNPGFLYKCTDDSDPCPREKRKVGDNYVVYLYPFMQESAQYSDESAGYIDIDADDIDYFCNDTGIYEHSERLGDFVDDDTTDVTALRFSEAGYQLSELSLSAPKSRTIQIKASQGKCADFHSPLNCRIGFWAGNPDNDGSDDDQWKLLWTWKGGNNEESGDIIIPENVITCAEDDDGDEVRDDDGNCLVDIFDLVLKQHDSYTPDCYLERFYVSEVVEQ